MIRFIDLGDQILEGERRFAWYDTICDEFIEFCGSVDWSSWEEFEQDFKDDITKEDISRFKRLFPKWFRQYEEATIWDHIMKRFKKGPS